MRRFASRIVAAGVLLVSTSCRVANLGTGVALGPFVDVFEAPEGRARQTNVLGPIVESAMDAEGATFAVRPLFVGTAKPQESRDEVKFLWPLGRYYSTPTEAFVRVLPLYFDRTWLSGEGWQRDWALFPILFGGTTPSQGGYFAVFPLFGTLKGYLARDEIHFILFPIYFDTRVGETHSVGVLWPFISVSRGPESSAVSVLPFYGYRSREGVYDRRFVLWPFFQWGHEAMDTDDPKSWVFAWPFYGQETSPSSSRHVVLWPFFSWANNDRTGYVAYDAPWPILKREKGRDIDRFRIWPLFGWTREKEIDSTFLLWPFIWDRHEHTDWTQGDHFYILPFLISMKRQTVGEPGESSYLKLWPLFYSDRSASGDSDFQIGTLVPFRLEGFEEVYGFLWSLYRRTEKADGSGHEETWLRTYSHRWAADFEEYRIPILWAYRRGPRGEVNHSFLLGLIQYESDVSGAGLRFFYLPRFPRW